MPKINNTKNIVIEINDKPVCAQKKAEIDRSAKSIDYTNKIDGEWSNNLSGVRSWKINCSGVFITNSEAFSLLEESYENGSAVKVKIADGNIHYEGSAIITSFPISINYEDAMTYRLRLLGDGPLNRVN